MAIFHSPAPGFLGPKMGWPSSQDNSHFFPSKLMAASRRPSASIALDVLDGLRGAISVTDGKQSAIRV